MGKIVDSKLQTMTFKTVWSKVDRYMLRGGVYLERGEG